MNAPAGSAEERREQLVQVFREGSTCTRCRLAETRTSVVFGAGDADADLMFIGEAPGAEEDKRGLPFVGRAGGLLNELLEGIGLSRDSVFIANTLMCRPPGNRDPQADELDACRPYLLEKVRLIEPKVIVTLGNFATKLITRNQTGITRVRGNPQIHTLGERTLYVFPILHPAAALRTPVPPGDHEPGLRGALGAAGGAAPPAGCRRGAGGAGCAWIPGTPAASRGDDQLDIFTP